MDNTSSRWFHAPLILFHCVDFNRKVKVDVKQTMESRLCFLVG